MWPMLTWTMTWSITGMILKVERPSTSSLTEVQMWPLTSPKLFINWLIPSMWLIRCLCSGLSVISPHTQLAHRLNCPGGGRLEMGGGVREGRSDKLNNRQTGGRPKYKDKPHVRRREERENCPKHRTVISIRYLREHSFWLASEHRCMAKRKQTGRRKL